MTQRARIAILIFGGLAIAFFVFYPFAWREPVYQGKRVSYWFNKFVTSFTPAREQAMEAVAELGSDAVPYLSRMLRKTESPVGRTYRTLWPKLPASVSRWLPQPILPSRLHSDAIACLCEIGQSFKTALPPLIAALDSPDSDTRWAAVLALSDIGPRDERIISALTRTAKYKDPGMRSSAIGVLAQWSGRPEYRALLRPIIPTFIEALHDPNSEVRGCAAQALAEFGRDASAAVPALIELQKLYANARTDQGSAAVAPDFTPSSKARNDSALDEKRRWTLREATKALLCIDPGVGEELLPVLLRTINAYGQPAQLLEFSNAFRTLGEKAAPVVPFFSKLLRDADFSIRMRAADALGAMGSAAQKALPELIAAIHDTNAIVRLHCASALAQINSENADLATKALVSLLNDGAIRTDAARELRKIGPAARAAIPALIKAFGESDSYLRQIAGESLWKIDPSQAPSIVPVFVELLNQKNLSHSSRRSLVELLGKIGPVALVSVPSLIEHLNHRDRRLQLAAAEALWRIDPKQTPRVITFLSYFLERQDYWFRDVAAELLGKIGPAAKAAVPALKRAIEHGDPILRERVNQALQKIQGDSLEMK